MIHIGLSLKCTKFVKKKKSKNIKKTAKIRENIDQYIFLQPYEKLWYKRNIHGTKFEWNFDNHINSLIGKGKGSPYNRLLRPLGRVEV